MCKQQQQQQHDDDGGGGDEEYQMGLNMRSLEKTSKCPLKNEVTSQYFLFIGLRLQSDNIPPFGQTIRHTAIHTDTTTYAHIHLVMYKLSACVRAFRKDIVAYSLLLFSFWSVYSSCRKG